MISKASDVDGYMAELPEERRPVMERLRALYLKMLPGYEETIEYGMPCYKLDGVLQVSIASQKQYISFYGMGFLVEEFREELKGANLGKGCIRFAKPEKIDPGVIERMLEQVRLRPKKAV